MTEKNPILINLGKNLLNYYNKILLKTSVTPLYNYWFSPINMKEKKPVKSRAKKSDEAKKPAKRKVSDSEEEKIPAKASKQAKLISEDAKIQTSSLGIFSSPEIHIVSWNVNGIRACIKKQSFITFTGRDNIDILCFNETKLQDTNIQDFKNNFPAFPYQYWSCSRTKKGYSGTAILSKIEPISIVTGLGRRKHDDEGRVITAEFDTFFLISTYVPNAGQKLDRLSYRTQEWDNDFRNYLKQLEARGKSVIWLGDLNVVHQDIDIYNMNGKEKCAGCTPQEREQFTQTLAEGFVDSFRHLYPSERKYSWYSTKNPRAKSENMGWRLDYIVVSQALISRVRDSLIHNDIIGSDHHPVEIILINN
ncbi:unnamed protein product [Blepharisma stoltei]|uniref:DNA-(apurinic or apyrimidinic site) endonuclease n=1 Tax=Blepharisma stoltei TaxID=1481888 RepID=A0AAU9JL77_9CILI|nr:unnamed protein product [Blepharisma stoltei]